RRGWLPSLPAKSCKDIVGSGDAGLDGKYWVRPDDARPPAHVTCDMTTNGGGWLLISSIEKIDSHDIQPLRVCKDYKCYPDIANFMSLALSPELLQQIKRRLGLTQMRFHCRKDKKQLDLITSDNNRGSHVIKYFLDEKDRPAACGYFERGPEDNSSLEKDCHGWESEKWGCGGLGTDLGWKRLYRNAIRGKSGI
ncbi:predicted protein, partial [Nematostella vectensis]